jgi:lysophospholipid acyltransferase (LPLAT)-like uncharacterized protein
LLQKWLLGPLVWLIYRSLLLTWRVELKEPDILIRLLKDKRPVVFAHWHGDELVLISLVSRYRIATIASTSKDGEIMNTVLRMLGASTSRGSSTRGAVSALKGLLRLAKFGHNVSFAVDGPKGPLHVVKPGVFELARVIRAPIFVAGVSVSHCWRFEKAWNKTYLPKPFAKILIEWDGPFINGEDIEDPRSEDLAKRLGAALHLGRDRASKNLR